MPNEPASTAVAMLVVALLLATAVLSSRATGRLGIPVALIFIGLGMAAGHEGAGGIAFEDYGLTFRLGVVALSLILFDGGLNTTSADIRRVLKPAGLLATLGVLLSTIFMSGAARLLGFSWGESLLIGAVVSSTDAAAVFGVLRGSGLSLKKRVATTLEVESGLNDPLAVILTVIATASLASGKPPSLMALALVPVQIAIGAGAGLVLALGARHVLTKIGMPGGLYAVLTVSLAFLAFAAPTLISGSGFLSVYVAGAVLGNGPLPYRSGLLRVHDALAWFAQILMFLLLGLLVSPLRLLEVAGAGTLLGLILAILVRPLSALPCLLPFRYPWRESLFVAWAGLRGAVPIILATYPVLAGVAGAPRVFDTAFFIVVLSTLVPGATIRSLVRLVRLQSDAAPPPPALLEITSTQLLAGEIMSFYIDAASSVAGARVVDIPFPLDAAAMLVVRGRELIAPRGYTIIEHGDHVHVFCRPEDRAFVTLLFGAREQD